MSLRPSRSQSARPKGVKPFHPQPMRVRGAGENPRALTPGYSHSAPVEFSRVTMSWWPSLSQSVVPNAAYGIGGSTLSSHVRLDPAPTSL